MFFACMYVGAAAVIREPRMDIQEAVMIANTTEPVLVIMGVADAGGMEDCFKNPAGEHSTGPQKRLPLPRLLLHACAINCSGLRGIAENFPWILAVRIQHVASFFHLVMVFMVFILGSWVVFSRTARQFRFSRSSSTSFRPRAARRWQPTRASGPARASRTILRCSALLRARQVQPSLQIRVGGHQISQQ